MVRPKIELVGQQQSSDLIGGLCRRLNGAFLENAWNMCRSIQWRQQAIGQEENGRAEARHRAFEMPGLSAECIVVYLILCYCLVVPK